MWVVFDDATGEIWTWPNNPKLDDLDKLVTGSLQKGMKGMNAKNLLPEQRTSN